MNVTKNIALEIHKDESASYTTFPIMSLLTSNHLHLLLSNSWDKYKCTCIEANILPTLTPLHTEHGKKYFKLFTAIDDNQPSRNISFCTIKSYSTYQETVYSDTASNTAPLHKTTFTKPFLLALNKKRLTSTTHLS